MTGKERIQPEWWGEMTVRNQRMWKARQQSCGVGETKVGNGIFSPEFPLYSMQSSLSLHSSESQLFPAELWWKQAKWIIARMQLHWFSTQYTVPCLFYPLQTWHLNCIGAKLSVCVFASLCVLEVCMCSLADKLFILCTKRFCSQEAFFMSTTYIPVHLISVCIVWFILKYTKQLCTL